MTRFGRPALFYYGKPDPEGKHPRSAERLTWSLPKEFEDQAIAGQIEGVLARGSLNHIEQGPSKLLHDVLN